MNTLNELFTLVFDAPKCEARDELLNLLCNLEEEESDERAASKFFCNLPELSEEAQEFFKSLQQAQAL